MIPSPSPEGQKGGAGRARPWRVPVGAGGEEGRTAEEGRGRRARCTPAERLLAGAASLPGCDTSTGVPHASVNMWYLLTERWI